MTVKGSQMSAVDVYLKAGKDIYILSAENSSTAREKENSSSASLGGNIGSSGLTGIRASYGRGREEGKSEGISHTESNIKADHTLSLESGRDTILKGSRIEGEKVQADAGGSLSMESEQDRKTYRENGKNTGISLGYDIPSGKASGFASAGKSRTNSHYESVINQAGIYAGDKGFDITVKDNTHLKGAVIDSKGDADKNTLRTGTLSWEDIENKADYKAGGMGISYAPKDSTTPLNARGLTPQMSPTVKDKAGSTTKAAIAKGTIVITDKKNQGQDISALNQDTQNNLNRLKEIFDKSKVEEKQELIQKVSQLGNEAIHAVSDHYGWKEGSSEKMLLHGALGALIGSMSGGSSLSGALSGSVNEFAMGYLEKAKGKEWMGTHPDAVQVVSMALGAAVGWSTGDGSIGAYTAQTGTKWNYYEKYPNMKKKISDYIGSEAYKQQKVGTAHVIYVDKSNKNGVLVIKDNESGAGRIIDLEGRTGEVFSSLDYPNMLNPYSTDLVFTRTDSGNQHPQGIYSFGEHDGYIVNNHSLYPDAVYDWTETDVMGKSLISHKTTMSIDKFSLAKDTVEGIGTYPFALASKYGVDAGHAKLLATGPLKALDIYQTWQDDWKNYSGIDWWGAQGINIGVPVFYHISHMAQTISYVATETNNPIIGAVISIIGESVSDELSEQLKDKAKKIFW